MLTFQLHSCFSADSCTAFREAALSVRASGTRYSPCKFGIQPPTVLLSEYCFADDDCIVNSEFSGWGELNPYTKLGKLVYYRYITAASVKIIIAEKRRKCKYTHGAWRIALCGISDALHGRDFFRAAFSVFAEGG